MLSLGFNIGLAVNGIDGGKDQELLTLEVAAKIIGNDAETKIVEAEYDGTVERTVVVHGETRFSLATLQRRIFAACKKLGQDCIAVSFDGGRTGVLIGPRAKEYGEFNAAYFVK